MEHLVKDDLWSDHDNKIYLAQKDFKNAYIPIRAPPFFAHLDIIQNSAIRLIFPMAGNGD